MTGKCGAMLTTMIERQRGQVEETVAPGSVVWFKRPQMQSAYKASQFSHTPVLSSNFVNEV